MFRKRQNSAQGINVQKGLFRQSLQISAFKGVRDKLEIVQVSFQIPSTQYIVYPSDRKAWTFNVNPHFLFHWSNRTMKAVKFSNAGVETRETRHQS